MPPGRKEANGRSASVSASLKSHMTKDPGVQSPGKIGSTISNKMSTSDHLIPIAPRSLPSLHDARLAYRPVMRQTSQQGMYSYHAMSSPGMPLHAAPASPYQAYYPRTMMLPSSGSSSDPMMPNLNYTAGTDVHPQVPVGVSHNTYAYPMPPWHAPTSNSRKRKSRIASQAVEKLQSPDIEHSADEDDSTGNRAEKRKERCKSIAAPKSADSVTDSTPGDPFPPLTIANMDGTSSRDKLSESESQVQSSASVGSPALASDNEDKLHVDSTPGTTQVAQSMSDDTCHQERQSPDTPDETYLHSRPYDSNRRLMPGVSKKVYSQSMSHLPVDVDKAIEPLSAFNAPLGLEVADELNHYKKTVALLHERLKKEHDHGRQVSLQRIRAEMMWEAVAQELRQLRVHLARLATQPLPTAMSSSMQMP